MIQGDPALRSEGEAACLINLGLCARVRHDDEDDELLVEAVGYYRQALAAARQTGALYPDAVVALSNLADVHIELEELQQAKREIAEALEISRAVRPGSRRTAILLANLGTAHARDGDLENAARC